MDLTGKIALVTGAASGIGQAAAERLTQAGATVIGADLHPVGDCLALDVADEDSVDGFFKQLGERQGVLHILVCAAGVTCRREIADMALADWQRVMAVNLTGVFLCCRAAVPLLRAAGGGAIVTIGSDIVGVAAKRLAAYGATKGGVVALTKGLALECAHDNIRVNCVAPGPTDTPLLKSGYDSAEAVAEARRRGTARTALERLGRPAEIAEVITFVVSDEASFMTGALVPVDGGTTA